MFYFCKLQEIPAEAIYNDTIHKIIVYDLNERHIKMSLVVIAFYFQFISYSSFITFL